LRKGSIIGPGSSTSFEQWSTPTHASNFRQARHRTWMSRAVGYRVRAWSCCASSCRGVYSERVCHTHLCLRLPDGDGDGRMAQRADERAPEPSFDEAKLGVAEVGMGSERAADVSRRSTRKPTQSPVGCRPHVAIDRRGASSARGARDARPPWERGGP
jgi:hypothetical protein